MSNPDEFLSVLRSEFPDDRVTFQKTVVTFHPESAAETALFFKLLNKHGQKAFISGFGNNVSPPSEVLTAMFVISTDRLNELHEVTARNLFVKAGAGFPLKEINSRVRSEGLFFPHAALPYVGSVGGAVSINLSAVLNGHDLPIKKYFIQAEIVTPEGEIINPGSVCFKSVSGYDVVKIFAPSWGLLGLIISATFRVLPLTAIDEYEGMKMQAVDRDRFLNGLDESNQETDAVYSRKIKSKFDPNGVLPVI
ncbi:MAG: hypothetical protein DRP45_05540 [Candidatus Zixiibacteriota bacterium]|nr:MAG: hypothetical protein DRP45_05540 [candidate division Zixibacteria bacterium]